ncbi:MAG: alpha/beta fold hydrolase [Acidimicrobiia bacterium]
MTTAHLDRAGVRLRFDVIGSGPVVLMTHGFAASSRMFAAAAERLAAEATVITWDMRGHGGSDYPPEQAEYSAALAVADMVALLDHVGADRATLLGHSLGGYLSLVFALDHPDRTSALVLVDTGPGFRKEAGRERWNQMAEGFAVRYTERGLGGMGTSDELDADQHRDATGLVLAARGILPQHDSRVIDGLPSITVPTLVVVGEHDTAFVDGSGYMAERIPGADLAVIAGAGHAPPVSHTDEFVAVVTAFMRSRRATTS